MSGTLQFPEHRIVRRPFVPKLVSEPMPDDVVPALVFSNAMLELAAAARKMREFQCGNDGRGLALQIIEEAFGSG